MADMKDIVRLAVDAYHGTQEKYSVAQSMDVLRQALIEANGGSTVLNYRNIRDGKCNGLFALVEAILARTVVDGLKGDEFFANLVEFRNLAEGDQNVFTIEDGTLFVVDDTAEGTQGIRRQRIPGVTEIAVPTTMKVVRIYEELNRVLAGRVDFNHMIDVVTESFRQKILNDVYTLWATATSADFGGAAYFNAGGNYNETTLLNIVSHVEAAAGGKTATLIGTKKALRMIAPSVQGVDSQNSLYNNGYYGKFYGSNVVAIPQRHKAGTTTFVVPDNVITIIASDDRPIKFVYEGDPLIIPGNPLDNADLTQEYLYGERYGAALTMAGNNSGFGHYETT